MIEPLQSELLIRKENGKPVPWVLQSYILKACETLSEEYLRVRVRPMYKKTVQPCFQANNILPDTGKAWRWAKINGDFYYCYDNIPNKAPAYYQTQLPTRYELLEIGKDKQMQEEEISSLTTFFNEYLNTHYGSYLQYYGDCTPLQQRSLAKAAACIQACIDRIVQQKIDVQKKTFFLEAAEWFAANDVKYLPHNYRCLKEKVLNVMDGHSINDVIKLPRSGNDNRRIYNDSEIESWIYQMRGMGENYTNAHIIRKVQYACELTCKPIPSDRWIGKIMESPNTQYITALGRYGASGRLGVFYKGYVPVKNAVFSGDCWQVDGTRVNIIDHKHVRIDENGEKIKSKEYLYMIMVRDVHSGDILGHSLGLAEDRWHYINALKMAVESTGYLPYQLVFDQFPGHNTPEFINFQKELELRGVKVTYTSKATGKAQIERWIDTFQNCFLQDSSYYYGQGIKSRRKFAHRSEEYLKAMKSKAAKSGWDFDAACDETEKLLTAYRTTQLCKYSRKHKMVQKSPMELHEDSDKPNVVIIQPHQFTYLFGLKKELQLKNEGLLTTEIQKYPFIYRTTDYQVIRKHKSVIICYHLDDLSQVHMYEVSDKPMKKYLGVANEVDSPQVYGPDAEFGKLARQQAIIKEISAMREQEYEYKKASGSDIVTLLSPASSNKYVYENAESVELSMPTKISPLKKETKERGFDSDVLNQF